MLTEPEFGVSDYSALIGTVSSLGRCVSGGRGVHISIGCTLMMVMVILMIAAFIRMMLLAMMMFIIIGVL